MIAAMSSRLVIYSALTDTTANWLIGRTNRETLAAPVTRPPAGRYTSNLMAEPSHDSLAPAGLGLEALSPLPRAFKTAVINPFANYMPAGLIRRCSLRQERTGPGQLERPRRLAEHGRQLQRQMPSDRRQDPGQWRHHADGAAQPQTLGSTPVSRSDRFGARVGRPEGACSVFGAGPGQIILDALAQARREAHATLVDLSADAFEYGMSLARQRGLDSRVRYIQADVRDLPSYLDRPPHVVKMMGILEYLTDEQILQIAGATPHHARFDRHRLQLAVHGHGTDRFFRRVFGLHMTYRSPEHVHASWPRPGSDNSRSIRNPWVFHVIVGRKFRRFGRRGGG